MLQELCNGRSQEGCIYTMHSLLQLDGPDAFANLYDLCVRPVQIELG
jgi:hypothetical protein